MANNKVHPTVVEITEDPKDDVQEDTEGKVEANFCLISFLKLILINCWSEEAKETSFLYYFSILSGPFVACFVGIFFCLIPMPNVLQQPSRWYEEILTRMYSGIPVIVCQILHQAELWTYFTFEKRWQTYLLVMGLTYATMTCTIIGYYFIWTEHLGLKQPMPMNQHIIASIAVTVMNIAVWFRYG